MTTSSPETVNKQTDCSSPDSDPSYFDLHIIGLGYVNRIREVTPKKGEKFLACTIAALNGPRDAVEKRYIDVRVSGKDAQHLIRRCMPASEADKKILIGFRLGDPWTDVFTYPPGHEKAGKTGVSEKARLLFISWIKVDGEMVYRAKSRSPESSSRPALSIVPSSDSSVETAAAATAEEAASATSLATRIPLLGDLLP